MKNKKAKKFFKGLFIFLFLVYLAIYVSESAGYYDFKNYKKSSLTEEQIREFERDIKSGKKVNLNNYTKVIETNYSNNLSDMGNNISNTVSSLVNECVTNFFNTVASLATE